MATEDDRGVEIELSAEQMAFAMSLQLAGKALLDTQTMDTILGVFFQILKLARPGGTDLENPLIILERSPAEVAGEVARAASDLALPLRDDFGEMLAKALEARRYILHDSLLGKPGGDLASRGASALEIGRQVRSASEVVESFILDMDGVVRELRDSVKPRERG